MLEGIVVLKVRRHHAWVLLWRQRVFFGLLVAIVLLFIVIVIAAFVLKIGRAFVFMRSAVLDVVSLARQ